MPEEDKKRDLDSTSDRGKRASFDRKTGAVSGSGAGVGNPEGSDEDHDSDLSTGSGGPAKGGRPDDAP